MFVNFLAVKCFFVVVVVLRTCFSDLSACFRIQRLDVENILSYLSSLKNVCETLHVCSAVSPVVVIFSLMRQPKQDTEMLT